jgi:molybdate transport system substrate-binding protein
VSRACAAIAVLVLLAGCGGGSSPTQPTVRVAAASSLTAALTACAPGIHAAHVQVEFGGSDQLAAQIRAGVRLDVFAAANTKLPAALAAEHRAGAPVPFATNELVLAVPRSSAIASLAELAAAPRTLVAIGSASVPVGAYTRQVLARLPAAEGRAILGDVRTQEPDVKGIVGKLVAGAVDAGFVYRTDVLATGGRLRAVALPAAVRPTVVYGVSAITDGAGSRAVIADMLHGGCSQALRAAGFGPAPA